jgi:hypothetical protein
MDENVVTMSNDRMVQMCIDSELNSSGGHIARTADYPKCEASQRL